MVATKTPRQPRKKAAARVAPTISLLRAYGGSPVSIANNEERVNPQTSFSTLTSMYKDHPIVRAAIDKIAKTCVANGYQFRPRFNSEEVNEAQATALQELFAKSKANSLLRQTYVDLLVYGDAYWFITKSRLGQPFAFIRQNPATISVVIDKETREVTAYVTRDAQGNELQFEPDEFLHFMLPDPDNDLYGLSPLQSLQTTVAQDLFAAQYNLNFFENSAQTGIVFNMKNASKEEVDRNREFLKKEYTSAANAHKPLVLEGDVSVSKSVSTPREMEYIEGRNRLTLEILAVLDMPYTKLGGTSESANRSQSTENDKSWRTETIIPLQTAVEEVINEDLIATKLSIEDTIFAHKEVDERSQMEKMEVFTQGLEKGVYKINDVREELGLKPIDGGDEAYINTSVGLIPVKDIAALSALLMEAKEAANKSAQAAAENPGAVAANNPNTPSGKSNPPSKRPKAKQ